MTDNDIPKLQEKSMELWQRAHAFTSQIIPRDLPPGDHPAVFDYLRNPMTFANKRSASGKFTLVPESNDRWAVVNMRNALFLGLKPLSIHNDGVPLTFHRLKGGKGATHKGVMTSDIPVEVHQQFMAFRKLKGHVLVTGLGMGMAATMIQRLPAVKSVTVIDMEQELIDFIAPQIDKRIRIERADAFQFCNKNGRSWNCPHLGFDSAYHDIWYGTGETTWVDEVVPLYRLCRKAGINRLAAWGEYEMRWQLISGCYRACYMPEELSHWKPPYRVFRAAVVKAGELGEPTDAKDAIVGEFLKLYLCDVGSPKWERTFGAEWDKPEPKRPSAKQVRTSVACVTGETSEVAL